MRRPYPWTALLRGVVYGLGFTGATLHCGAGAAPGGNVSERDSSVGDAGIGDATRDGDTGAIDARNDASNDAGPVGAICTFNRDCVSEARCECLSGDCKCALGPRGKGKSGVDLCTDGNDCESSLCVDGTGDVLTCSGECKTAADCGPKLPICSNIATLGKICVRATP